jgi:hypothetical protein
MNGTEWVEPGQGATVYELSARFRHTLPVIVRKLVVRHGINYRSNLRLTGEPLTVEDVARIAEAR